ncbi:ADP-ribosylglycohydrolase family protein [Methanospirillum hungatei]|uniref:ADP-ribosylglycohydrolase family protein n=1 Tax=Methanospirillum hungatei TaxID=2203 RepID=UPI0026F09855|nr:ADP-ribosylglycohydrolase family protein [Methanospirillum hungatei]MCA1916786.1 ADP-ribosylglycohydrolase family protein [Methanospirillum hungatei]
MTDIYSPGARMLLGIAIGDACGAPFENLSFQDATNKLASVGLSPTRYTDDTQQALAIAEMMASGDEITPLKLANSFLTAYARDPRHGYSRQTLRMLLSPDPTSFLTSIPDHEKSERKTDGAAMRAPPLGFFPDRRKVIESAVLCASITHGHPDAIAATVAVSLLTHERLYQATPYPNLWRIIRNDVRNINPDMISWCDTCAGLLIPDREILLGEYAPYGVPYTESRIFLGVVIFLLTRYWDDPCRLLKEAIQLGGDTDTVAAVVLGIALIRGGEKSRIWDLVEGIEDGPYGREYVISIGNSLSERFSQ